MTLNEFFETIGEGSLSGLSVRDIMDGMIPPTGAMAYRGFLLVYDSQLTDDDLHE